MTTVDLRDRASAGPRLTAEEDGILRRLHYFECNGVTLALPMQTLKAELRARDRRAEIREPVIEEFVGG